MEAGPGPRSSEQGSDKAFPSMVFLGILKSRWNSLLAPPSASSQPGLAVYPAPPHPHPHSLSGPGRRYHRERMPSFSSSRPLCVCTLVPTQQVGCALAQSPGPVATTPVPWTACVVPEASEGCRGLQGWLWLQVRAVRGLLLLLLGTSLFPTGPWGQPPALCIRLLLGLFHERLLDLRGSAVGRVRVPAS